MEVGVGEEDLAEAGGEVLDAADGDAVATGGVTGTELALAEEACAPVIATGAGEDALPDPGRGV